MKKTITTLLAGVSILFALAAPVHAQEAKPADAPAAAATAPAAAAPEAPAAPAAAPAAAAPAAAAAPDAPAAPAPTPQKGDTAWMMVATLLVILMTIPGLALFYGGLVRSKNMLSILMQVFMVFALIVVLWCVFAGIHRRQRLLRQIRPCLPERHLRSGQGRVLVRRHLQQGRGHS